MKHAEAGEVVSLRPLGDRLPDTKTSAIVRTPGFEAVRLVVRAGAEIPEHKVPGRITPHCIEGAVDLGLPDGPRQLRAGDWIWLQGGEPHSVRGVEDASMRRSGCMAPTPASSSSAPATVVSRVSSAKPMSSIGSATALARAAGCPLVR